MPEDLLPPPAAPTFYFIGVTTGKSQSRYAFPRWMDALGRPEVQWHGVDLAIHAPPGEYRRVVQHIRDESQALGGLVTTHKIDLLAATRDLFDDLGPYARGLGEISSIAKDGDRLVGRATDPVAGGSSLDALLGPDYFGRTGGHVLLLGAGGAAAALTLHLLNKPAAADRPKHIVVVNRSPGRLQRLRELVAGYATDIDFTWVENAEPGRNDQILAALPASSVVINATGMGKDTPGSPLTDRAVFPLQAVAWDLNYRGELDFLQQARFQQAARELEVEDGWDYFIRGWTQVISHVLHETIDDGMFARLAKLAVESSEAE
jgi:shikimate 5-dehydrogenase